MHDQARIDYLTAHIKAMKAAVEEEGVDLIGYTPWVIDLVSFTTGEMKKRYGMIYVDRNNEGQGTLNRFKKDSLLGTRKLLRQTDKICLINNIKSTQLICWVH